MTQLQTLTANSGTITQLADNFRATSPAGLYGIDPATTTGLTLGYYGGQFNGATVADGTVVLTASATNYVVAHRTTGAVTAAATTTNWLDTTTYLQLYQFVAGAASFTIATTSDKRQAIGGSAGGGGGGPGTVTSVDASGGVETASGAPITATGTVRGATLVNAQTGTTYTYVTGDRGKLVTHSNAASIAGTLPQATSTFGAGWFMRVKNKGAGTLTITPTTSTIDGTATLVLTTGQWAIVVSDGVNYQVYAYAPAGGAGLTNWTEAVSTSAPNATVPVVSFVASNGAANVDAALVAKGTGAIAAQVADSTSAGGNKRGIYSVDWQRSRTAAANVASQQYSVIGGGTDNKNTGSIATIAGGNANVASNTYAAIGGGSTNTASGDSSAIPGGASCTASGQYSFSAGSSNNVSGTSAGSLGASNTVSGNHSFGFGQSNTVNAQYSFVHGNQGSARALVGARVHSVSSHNAVGDLQSLGMVLRCSTSNATPAVMTTTNAAASTTNQAVLQNNQSAAVTGKVVARDSSGNTASWTFAASIKRGANAAATAMVAACTPVQVAADAGASTWALSVTADTTNGALAVTFTGAAATNIRAGCVIEDIECTF